MPTFCPWHIGALAVIAVAVAEPTRAQEPAGPGPLITDRPDATESSETVRPGLVQFEAGWTYLEDNEAGTKTAVHAVPQLLARIGILGRLEGRVGFAGWNWSDVLTDNLSTSTSGSSDVELGFKYRLADGQGLRPQLAFLGGVTLPIGQEEFGGERVDPNFRFALSSELSSWLSVGANAGAIWSSFAGTSGTETEVDFLYTLAFGFGLSPRFGAFIESFGTVGLSEGASSGSSFDGGFTVLVTDNLQFDLSGGVGLNSAPEDWFVGAGASWRVPR